MIWFIISLCLVFLLLILCFAKLTFKLQYKHNKDDDLLSVNIFVWAIHVYTFEAPIIKIAADSPALLINEKNTFGDQTSAGTKKKITIQMIVNWIRRTRDIINHVVTLHTIVKRFLKKVHIKELYWHSELGLGDAVLTGQASGAVWTLKGLIIGTMARYMRMKQVPKLSITPQFQRLISQTDFSCMISFRAGHAIIAGLMIVKHWKGRPLFSRANHTQEENI